MEKATLLEVPYSQLFQVEDGRPVLLDEGPFSICCLQEAGEMAQVQARVGSTAWLVQPGAQTLTAGQLTFVFSVSESPAGPLFYTLVLAADTEPEAVGILEAILEELSVHRESALLQDSKAQAGEAALARGTMYKHAAAKHVHSASTSIAQGLMVSATWASGAIGNASKRWQSGEATEQPVRVGPGLKKRLRATAQVAKWVSSAAGSISSGIAWVGSSLIGGALWLTGANKPLKEGEEPGFLREVSQAAASGVGDVWSSMEAAGYIVLASARDGSADVVEHRYGADAAEAAREGMDAAVASADAALSFRKIGPVGVARSGAKKTAKRVLKNMAE